MTPTSSTPPWPGSSRQSAAAAPDVTALVQGSPDPARRRALDLRRAGRRGRAGRRRPGPPLRARGPGGRLGPEHPRVAPPHLRGGHGRSRPRAREPGPEGGRGRPHPAPVGSRRPSSTFPASGTTIWPGSSTRSGPIFPSSASRRFPGRRGLGGVLSPSRLRPGGRRTRRPWPSCWPAGRRDRTMWPSSSTPRGPPGRRRGPSSPTGG